jgi:HPr kinase/phosphorylase
MHATAVAAGGMAVLLRGPSGSGKSDLALRLIRGPHSLLGPFQLVADDQVLVQADADRAVTVSCPAAIAGLLEIRGLGIVLVTATPHAHVRLVVDLVARRAVARMPEPALTTPLCGGDLPVLHLHAFDASTPLKITVALERIVAGGAREWTA